MDKNIKENIRKLRLKKYSYEEIGHLFGISRQRVHQIVTQYIPPSKMTKEEQRNKKTEDKKKDNDLRSLYNDLGLSKDLIEKAKKKNPDNILKEIVRIRDNYSCQMCGRKQKKNGRKLDVHHIKENKKRPSDKLGNLSETTNMITLCQECHTLIHDRDGSAKESGKKGGKNTLKKYGSLHFSKLARKRWAKEKKKKVDNYKVKN